MNGTYDNDDNPYIEFKLHRYSNLPQDIKKYGLKEKEK